MTGYTISQVEQVIYLQFLRRANFRLGERDRLGRRGRRPADRLLPVLYDSYRGIQA
jgi:hypothetical protein